LQSKSGRLPHLSGQPGGRHVSTPPVEPEAMNGGLCERVRPGARKNIIPERNSLAVKPEIRILAL